MLKTYLKINNINQFYKIIKELQPEYYDSNLSVIALPQKKQAKYYKNKKTFYKYHFYQKPTKYFYKLINLVNEYEKNPHLHVKKKLIF